MFDPSNEVAIPGLHAQILGSYTTQVQTKKPGLTYPPANLRVLHPEIQNPIVTTCYTSKKWIAVVFGDERQIVYSTRGYEEKAAVYALRKLLDVTSGAVEERFDLHK